MLTPEEASRKLQDLIKDIRIAMLVTQGAGGELHGRPMQTEAAPFDGRLWFFTSGATTKAADLRRTERASLVYADSSHQRYVFITGIARLVNDPVRKRELWKPQYRMWFRAGLDDPQLRLLQVTVERALYWTRPGLIGSALATAAAVLTTGEAPELGESGTLEFELPKAPNRGKRPQLKRAREPAANVPKPRRRATGARGKVRKPPPLTRQRATFI